MDTISGALMRLGITGLFFAAAEEPLMAEMPTVVLAAIRF
jgi:hypothetical protein